MEKYEEGEIERGEGGENCGTRMDAFANKNTHFKPRRNCFKGKLGFPPIRLLLVFGRNLGFFSSSNFPLFILILSRLCMAFHIPIGIDFFSGSRFISI